CKVQINPKAVGRKSDLWPQSIPKRPLRDQVSTKPGQLQHFNASTSAKHDSGLPVRFSAQATSSDDGVKNTCSTRADVGDERLAEP
ncbi:hypothetical protein ACSDR0_42650, partial [Streptosporangium sp. G11]|uniref:hypothetical protein n=1 Tax=Streptosporangium sp. G11 TaxID=3436926 RepID=UPI003EBE5C7E